MRRAFGIDEEIVDVAASLDIRDGFAVRHGEHGKFRWIAKGHENSTPIAIDGHRKIAALGHGPGCELLSGRALHHRDRMVVGQIDEDAIPGRSESFLDVLSMARSGPCCGSRDRATANPPSPKPTTTRLAAASIRTLSASLPSSICPAVLYSFPSNSRTEPSRALATIERIGRWLVADALWFVQPGNGPDQAAVGQIDDADTVIAKFGDEQPLPLHIDRHVIDAAAHIAEQNFGFELKRSFVRWSG